MRREIEKLTKELQAASSKVPSNEGLTEDQSMREQLNEFLENEEMFWHQRSRINWLREGDRNTAYFYAQASQRRKVNLIMGLEDGNGVWCEKQDDITDTATIFFKHLLMSQGMKDPAKILRDHQKRD